jgi:dipeptide transport system permease protein
MAEMVSPAPIAKPIHPRLRVVLPPQMKILLSEPNIVLGGGFILLLAFVAIFAPFIAPYDPIDQDLLAAALPPAGIGGADPGHLLGTDNLGRDVLSRLIFGARVALIVAVVAAGLSAVVGTALGLLAGWYRGAVDATVLRLVDIWMAFPPVLLSILLVAVIGSGVVSVIVAIAIIDWTRFCRVIRAETMAQATQDYVLAARAVGYPRWRILLREILPNLTPVLLALVSLEMGIAVIVEAILSFVGLSVSSDTPTWGGMIAEGRQFIHQTWWVLAAPLAALSATVLSFNQLGDGLRRALDPVLRR